MVAKAEIGGLDCHHGDGGDGKGSYLGNVGRAKQAGLSDGLDGECERERSGMLFCSWQAHQ